MNNLKVLEVQRELEILDYPTPLAIAKEIVDFTQDNDTKIANVLKRISKNEPWEYIRGWKMFKDKKIFINKHTLIPRIETEEIVDIVLKKAKKIKEDFQIFDIGTGSGCIGISLSEIFKDTDIYATDVSKKALEVAKRNIEENHCKNIKLFNANLLDFNFDTQKPTIIIANLPYLPTKNIEHLDDSVKKHEPLLALDGGEKGFELYKELIEQIVKKDLYLLFAVFEIDESIVEYFKNHEILHDSFGRERFCVILPTQLM